MAAATSITLNDVKRAHSAIREHINLSPCSASPRLSARSDCQLQFEDGEPPAHRRLQGSWRDERGVGPAAAVQVRVARRAPRLAQ